MSETPPAARPQVFLCPHCQRPMPGDARVCPSCGVDLVLIALLAERASLEGVREPDALPVGPGAVVPRLGEYLIEQGVLSAEQLQAALARQAEWAASAPRRLLGQTLLEMGFVDRETLDRAITRQIVELHSALQDANRTLERRVAERTLELRRALKRLSELNQLKANLISNVSHELRTPLAHIKGYIELLIEDRLGPLTPDQARALGVVRRATDRLERLIEDLIEFSSAAREGLVLRTQSVDVAQLTSEVFSRSSDKAERAGVQLTTDFPRDLPAVTADPERLAWVLHQLVDNGVKFTPSGGSVRVAAARQDARVVIAVHDTGIGIEPERQAEVFDPLHQLDGSATRRYGGTGIGLAMARMIVEAHGSSIALQSEPGTGTEVSFPLPIAGDPA